MKPHTSFKNVLTFQPNMLLTAFSSGLGSVTQSYISVVAENDVRKAGSQEPAAEVQDKIEVRLVAVKVLLE